MAGRRIAGALAVTAALLLSCPSASGRQARSLRELAEEARSAPDSLELQVEYLQAWITDPANRAPRWERREVERSLARRILVLDPGQPLALEVAVRWELDEVFWTASNEARFGTKYFSRKREEAEERLNGLLEAWHRVAPEDPRPYREMARFQVLKEDWEALARTSRLLTHFRPEDELAPFWAGVAHQYQGNERSAAVFFTRGLERLDPGDRSEFEDPGRFSRDAHELDPVRADTLGAYAAARFWSLKDPRFLTPENERRSEHYARMTIADLLFGRGPDKRGWDTVEGDLVVRYGLPPDPLVILAPYGRLPDPLSGLGEPRTRRVTGLDGASKFWPIPELGGGLMIVSPFRDGRFEFAEPVDAHDAFVTAPQTYGHEVPGRLVEFPHVVSVFRGPDSKARVITAYGLPIEKDLPDVDTLDVVVHAGYFLTGPDRIEAESRRTVTGLPVDGLSWTGPDRLWTGVIETLVAPGRYGASTEFELGDRSAVGFQRDSLVVRSFDPGILSMSDVMPARLVTDEVVSPGPQHLSAGGLTVYPAPWGVFESGQPIYLYFEVYGLTPDAAGRTGYRLDAVIAEADRPSWIGRLGRAAFGRRNEGVGISFEADPGGRDDSRYFVLDTSSLIPGAYRLTVRITDRNAARFTESERYLQLIAPGIPE